jgi:hypothetical protein
MMKSGSLLEELGTMTEEANQNTYDMHVSDVRRWLSSSLAAFLIGSMCMIASAIFGVSFPDGRALYYFAAMANGLQNGMTSTYSANLIRTSHLTGTSTDIGLIAGQMLRGNMKNYWKFKVLVGLASSFWLGGLISFYSAQKFLTQSLWFSAVLYLLVGVTHVVYVTITQRVSFVQALTGTWKWDKVLETMASSLNPEGGGLEAGMTDEQLIASSRQLIRMDRAPSMQMN